MDKKYTKMETCPEHGEWLCDVSEIQWKGPLWRTVTVCPKCSEEKLVELACDSHGKYMGQLLTTTTQNGEFYESAHTTCPACDSEREAAYHRSVEADVQARVGRVGVPPRFAGKTLENYTADGEGQAIALAWAKDYLAALLKDESKGRSCLLLGDPGTGKTHLCTAIALEAARQGLEARYTTAQRMFRAIKETFNKGSDKSSTEVIREFSTVDLLVIDEVGIQFGSEFESNHLFDILDERYSYMRPTLLASNLPRAEVVKYLGERVIDRFREDGGSIRMFSWKSHRGGGA